MKVITIEVANNEDADFLASSIRGIAATNHIDAEVVVEDVPEPAPRLISDELRKKILEDRAFLRDYAWTTFCGDGMEEEEAALKLEGEDDEFLLECYFSMCHDAGVVSELLTLDDPRVKEIRDNAGFVEDGEEEEKKDS